MKCVRCQADKDLSLFTDGQRTFKQCAPCRESGRKRFKAHYEAKPEKVHARTARWRKENPEKQRAIKAKTARGWRAKYPEKKSAQNRDWNSRNKARRLAKTREYQARKANAMPSWADTAAIEQIYRLAARLREEGQVVHVDHDLPLKGKDVCGLHVPANLRIVPRAYNVRKGNRRRHVN